MNVNLIKCSQTMENMNTGTKATILNVQRLSTEDGPGIRTTVFFKGCPLHCSWCHNPESIHLKSQIHWMAIRCIGCNSCIQICPENALIRNEEGLIIDRHKCTICGLCWQECPANAIEVLGKQISVEELINEVIKDETYYRKSDGGVTYSGGEPTLQSRFVIESLKQLKQMNIQTALDTCGFFAYETLEKILPFTDLVLYDLKLIDSALHTKYTGQSNEIILKNLDNLISDKAVNPDDFEIWIRTPLIPDITATKENLTGIAAYLLNAGIDHVGRWELCAFNNLCQDKYKRLDMEWEFIHTPLMTRIELDECREWCVQTGFPSDKVIVTGAAKVECT